MKKATAGAVLGSILLILSGLRAEAIGEFPADPVSAQAYVSLTAVPPGSGFKVAVEVRIAHPWHINANRVDDPYLIPTELKFDLPRGVSLRDLSYPEGVKKKLSFSSRPLSLYRGKVLVGALLELAPDFPPGDTVLTATLTYQACDQTHCLPPEQLEMRIPLKVSARGHAIDAANPEVFEQLSFTSKPPSHDQGEEGRLREALESRGLPFLLLLVFIWGLALDLTPCVYPIIPITVGYFGGQSGGKTSRTFLLAVLYVLGMAIMYSSLGLAASLTGSMLGSALQNPIVLSLVAAVLTGLALSMFGLYEFRLPAGLSNLAGGSKAGAMGALLMGLTVGVVAAPCIGPFVLGLMTFVGERGDPILGFVLFFTLALGLGLPFLVLALASGSISRLPRSGEWMEWVRRLFGVVLLAMALYFLEPVLGRRIYLFLTGLLLAGSGLLLGFLIKAETRARFFIVLRGLFGVSAAALGLFLIVTGVQTHRDRGGIEWTPYREELLTRARSQGQLVMIDFYADWCIPCKELDYKTFSAPEVVKEAEGILALKADLTQSTSPAVARLRKQFGIRGVPTVVFLGTDGKEEEDLRVLGFVDDRDFLDRLRRFKGMID